MIDKEEIYAGGFYKLMRELDRRQRPFDDLETVLPDAHADLTELYRTTVEPTSIAPDDCPKYSAQAKWIELQHEFQGQNQLFHIHAFLIAVSRRRDPPDAALHLFFRMWFEMGNTLAKELSTRWLISACTTFADVGQNADQRALGMGLSTAFDLIKLHDSERRITGQPGNTPFRRQNEKKRPAMPFRMKPYSLKNGDLDRVMLSRFWQISERDDTIRPLAVQMLRMLMTDRRSIFGRVQKFKNRPNI